MKESLIMAHKEHFHHYSQGSVETCAKSYRNRETNKFALLILADE